MTDTIKIDKLILNPEIFLEISPAEIGSYKINNLSKKFDAVEVPESGEAGQGRAATLTQMVMGSL